MKTIEKYLRHLTFKKIEMLRYITNLLSKEAGNHTMTGLYYHSWIVAHDMDPKS